MVAAGNVKCIVDVMECGFGIYEPKSDQYLADEIENDTTMRTERLGSMMRAVQPRQCKRGNATTKAVQTFPSSLDHSSTITIMSSHIYCRGSAQTDERDV
jgi:hypothetical protein